MVEIKLDERMELLISLVLGFLNILWEDAFVCMNAPVTSKVFSTKNVLVCALFNPIITCVMCY